MNHLRRLARFVANRFREPSTYISASALAVLLGLSYEEAETILNTVAGLSAIAGMLLPENGSEDRPARSVPTDAVLHVAPSQTEPLPPHVARSR